MKNEPAFPLHNHGAQTLGMHLSGMTLRDYFAAKAMQAMISQYAFTEVTYVDVPFLAYQVADAMVLHREHKK